MYCLTFHIALSDSSFYATNNIGVFFSQDSIQPLNTGVLNRSPQVNVTNIISETSKWTEISRQFTATGGEKYLIFGNFYSDSMTDTISTGVNPTTFNGQKFALYYLDNISLCLCSDTLTNASKQLFNDEVNVYPNPANETVTISVTGNHSAEIIFYNLQSEAVMHATLPSKIKNIDIKSLASGVYFVNIITEKGCVMKKLVKK